MVFSMITNTIASGFMTFFYRRYQRARPVSIPQGSTTSEMDSHEDLADGGLFGWVNGPELKAVDKYLASVKKFPNPPVSNITRFGGG
jgi:hypothetical protein